MRAILGVALAVLLFFPTYAQNDSVKYWFTDGEFLGSFANNGYGEYWSQGGQSNVNINGILSVLANHSKDRLIWDNGLKLEYGMSKNSGDNEFRKSADLIDLISKVGYGVQGSDKWYYAGLLNFKSQISPTQELLYNIEGAPVFNQSSKLFAPADISLSLGMDYKPNENFSAFISPVASKLRVIANDSIASSGVYGNEVRNLVIDKYSDWDKTKTEFGASAVSIYNKKFLKDQINVGTKLELFTDYTNKPENVDFIWSTLNTFNPWKFIQISYSTELRYDHDILLTSKADGSPLDGGKKRTRGVQFKNLLGIGLTYKFFQDKE